MIKKVIFYFLILFLFTSTATFAEDPVELEPIDFEPPTIADFDLPYECCDAEVEPELTDPSSYDDLDINTDAQPEIEEEEETEEPTLDLKEEDKKTPIEEYFAYSLDPIKTDEEIDCEAIQTRLNELIVQLRLSKNKLKTLRDRSFDDQIDLESFIWKRDAQPWYDKLTNSYDSQIEELTESVFNYNRRAYNLATRIVDLEHQISELEAKLNKCGKKRINICDPNPQTGIHAALTLLNEISKEYENSPQVSSEDTLVAEALKRGGISREETKRQVEAEEQIKYENKWRVLREIQYSLPGLLECYNCPEDKPIKKWVPEYRCSDESVQRSINDLINYMAEEMPLDVSIDTLASPNFNDASVIVQTSKVGNVYTIEAWVKARLGEIVDCRLECFEPVDEVEDPEPEKVNVITGVVNFIQDLIGGEEEKVEGFEYPLLPKIEEDYLERVEEEEETTTEEETEDIGEADNLLEEDDLLSEELEEEFEPTEVVDVSVNLTEYDVEVPEDVEWSSYCYSLELQLQEEDYDESILTLDSDSDSIPDLAECVFGTDPSSQDSDGDEYLDAEEVISDNADPNIQLLYVDEKPILEKNKCSVDERPTILMTTALQADSRGQLVEELVSAIGSDSEGNTFGLINDEVIDFSASLVTTAEVAVPTGDYCAGPFRTTCKYLAPVVKEKNGAKIEYGYVKANNCAPGDVQFDKKVVAWVDYDRDGNFKVEPFSCVACQNSCLLIESTSGDKMFDGAPFSDTDANLNVCGERGKVNPPNLKVFGDQLCRQCLCPQGLMTEENCERTCDGACNMKSDGCYECTVCEKEINKCIGAVQNEVLKQWPDVTVDFLYENDNEATFGLTLDDCSSDQEFSNELLNFINSFSTPIACLDEQKVTDWRFVSAGSKDGACLADIAIKYQCE